MTDTEIIRAIEINRWQISFNIRIMRWIVQEQQQVTGNIGTGTTIKYAVEQAIETTKNK